MIQRFAPLFGGLYKDGEVLLGFGLTDILLQCAGAQTGLHLGILGGVVGGDHAVFKVHIHIKALEHRSTSPPGLLAPP